MAERAGEIFWGIKITIIHLGTTGVRKCDGNIKALEAMESFAFPDISLSTDIPQKCNKLYLFPLE